MPDQQPININEQKDDWDGLQRTLNYMFKDVYSILDNIMGRGNSTFAPYSITLPDGTTINYVLSHDHTSDEAGGDYPWADMTQSDTQADAVAVSAISAAAGADTIDRTALNGSFTTLVTEINAIKDVLNDLIDKMQTANLMT